MVSHQKIQNSLKEMKAITKRNMALYQTQGRPVATTDASMQSLSEVAASFGDSLAEKQIYQQYQFYRVMVEGEFEYVFVLEGIDDTADIIAQMAVCQIRTLIQTMEEKFDRNNLIQNILLGNMLTVDIFARAKKLRVEDVPRVVFAIDTGNKNNDAAMALVKNLSDLRTGDFVTSVDEQNIILVKDVSAIAADDMEGELALIAASLVDNLQMEAMIKVRVGYGNVVQQLPQIVQSYQEAKLALEVGHVFYAGHDTISYGKLGIGRLIYQLPMSLCEMYIQEVFGSQIPEILDDEEAMSTIEKFFENNLNISETARQLYVHRNTLVYRLERIEKAVGLDIRRFDDAMSFRIAVMVLSHMRENQ